MIYLRHFKNDDIPLMLEWMKDPEINRNFVFDPNSIDHTSIQSFIEDSQSMTNKHYAISNEVDEYLGSISLKKIDLVNRTSEYAISLRKSLHGKGIAHEATRLILKKAFIELNLHRVYFNVLEDNLRARAFYEKFGFIYEGCFKDHLWINGQSRSLCWYRILNDEFKLLDRKN